MTIIRMTALALTAALTLAAACDSVPWKDDADATAGVDIVVEDPDTSSSSDTGPTHSCVTSDDCDDGLLCREGECVECLQDGDCTAGGENVIATCNYNVCEYEADLCAILTCDEPFVCSPTEGCILKQQSCEGLDDGNPCTFDFCNDLTGESFHIEDSCDDGDQKTEDTCLVVGGQAQCHHTDIPPACLELTCQASHPCEEAFCNFETGQCDTKPLYDGKVTYVDSDGVCQVSCQDPSKTCSDGLLCTIDACEDDGSCSYTPKTCNDGNPDTAGECITETGECVQKELEDPCLDQDGDPCTIPTEESGTCVEVTQCDPDTTVCEIEQDGSTTCQPMVVATPECIDGQLICMDFHGTDIGDVHGIAKCQDGLWVLQIDCVELGNSTSVGKCSTDPGKGCFQQESGTWTGLGPALD